MSLRMSFRQRDNHIYNLLILFLGRTREDGLVGDCCLLVYETVNAAVTINTST